MRKYALSLVIFFSLSCSVSAQNPKKVLYKQIDTTQLFLDIYYPEKVQTNNVKPTIIFFFGGGWNSGTIKQFEPHARYFSEKGLVCMLADYRVNKRQQTTPFESLKDAKSAMRYVRKNAKELGIDPNRIVASGGSAGGHLAAATALIKDFNDPGDDLSVSCIPNALILFNPVIDNGPGGYGFERIGEKYKEFSPLHNIQKDAPPTILFLGSEDKHIPVETAKYYQTVMKKVGSRCELFLYEGAAHGFFNKPEYHPQTLLETGQFLESIGYLKK